jgi:FtsH-binding integral membrane protein
VFISFLLVPTWVLDWLARIDEYRGYVTMGITLTALLDGLVPRYVEQWVYWGIGLVCAAVFLWLTFQTQRKPQIWQASFAWAGFVTFLFHPHGLAYEQVALLIPFFLWAGGLRQTPGWLLVYWLAVLLFSWVAYVLSFQHPRWDYTPVLINGVWVLWLVVHCLRGKSRHSSPAQVTVQS